MPSGKTLKRRAQGSVVGFVAWIAAVTIFLMWQAAKYEGLMSLLGEWQFNALGRHYATFNYVAVVVLLCLPGYLLFLKPRKQSDADRPEVLLFRSARTFLRVLMGGGAALGIVALLMVVLALLLPGTAGPLQRIDLARPLPTQPSEGPTELFGTVVYERTAGFDEDLLVARRTFRFAPVVGDAHQNHEVQYFVQFAPADAHAAAGSGSFTGVLKRNGLPGEIIRLFRYAGYQIDEPHYVLFVEPAAMRWPYLVTAAQFALGAALVLALGLFQRRQVRRIDRHVHAVA